MQRQVLLACTLICIPLLGRAADKRLSYAEGMVAMYGPLCERACLHEDADCFTQCMGAQHEGVGDEFEEEEAACNAAGGIWIARMPACTEALEGMMKLNEDSSLLDAAQVINAIYRACSAEALCEGPEQPSPQADE